MKYLFDISSLITLATLRRRRSDTAASHTATKANQQSTRKTRHSSPSPSSSLILSRAKMASFYNVKGRVVASTPTQSNNNSADESKMGQSIITNGDGRFFSPAGLATIT